MDKAPLKECLLIDDDRDDQEIFLMALQMVDPQIKCSVVSSGIEGLQKLSEDISYAPYFIFLDINMHKMDGIECLRRIRELGHLNQSKIIMFSTSADVAIIRQCKELGASDFLTKPTGLKPLVNSLTTILKG
ncbi:MAG: response regulator [Bacteroidota bacterium]|nr:response regulator [Bacteroidota bacterium]